MRIRSIAFTIIFLCMIGGLFAGLFSHSIEAALTLQSINGAKQASGGATPSPTATKASGSGKPTPTTPTTPATPVPGGVTVLAKDTFQRAAQT